MLSWSHRKQGRRSLTGLCLQAYHVASKHTCSSLGWVPWNEVSAAGITAHNRTDEQRWPCRTKLYVSTWVQWVKICLCSHLEGPPDIAIVLHAEQNYNHQLIKSSLQEGEEVNGAQMSIAGRPGPVTIGVRDTAGEGGSSALKPDSLNLQLLPGAPATLIFSNPPQGTIPTRGVLPALTIQALDAHGNHVSDCPVFEVSFVSLCPPFLYQ